jgi:hypothetical protein
MSKPGEKRGLENLECFGEIRLWVKSGRQTFMYIVVKEYK